MEAKVKKRKRGHTRVSSKHQITIPVEVLREAGLGIGTELRVRVLEPGRVLLEDVQDPIDKFAGSLTGVYPEGYLDELRDEWER
jgi:bifunctional DNA-binding transcriptional regulator/antitoxin component of YhaV-PrlF toxin-antitoxin module